MGKILMLFGVPGVGKSTLVERVCSNSDRFRLFSASEFILKRLKNHLRRDSLRDLPKQEITDMQFEIAAAIRKLADSESSKVILVDGHSVIDTGLELIIVPVKAIEKIDPSAIAFVFDSPKDIHIRRTNDRQRSRLPKSISEIEEEQNLALSTCESFATALDLPILVIGPHQELRIAELGEALFEQ